MNGITQSNKAIIAQKANALKNKLNDSEFSEFLARQLNNNPAAIDRFKKNLYNACVANAKLLNVSPQSIISSAITSVMLGLTIDSFSNEGHIIPYGGAAQFIIGYKGLIKLCEHDGLMIGAGVARQADEFSYHLGTEPKIIHNPLIDVHSNVKHEITHAYAYAKKHGVTKICVIPRAEIKTKDNAVWKEHYEAMATKTAIRRLCRRQLSFKNPALEYDIMQAKAHEDGKVIHLNEDNKIIENKPIVTHNQPNFDEEN